MMLLMMAGALYVGNKACEPCHQEIAHSYKETPMAQSSGLVIGGLTPGAFRHPASSTDYQINSTGDVSVTNGAGTANWKLNYFIGSGAAGRSFLTTIGGFVFQAPVTWYTNQARWDVSPGYEKDIVSRWSRAVEPECLACHSSQVRFAKGYQNRYADPPFAQNGIGCERCHGPGSQHIAGREPLTNPAKLSPPQRDSVCAQCHMSGEARVNRAGKNFLDFRPGDVLSSSVAYFVYAQDSAVKATGYVERLATSRCKIAAGDRLWCGTCHSPHRIPAAQDRVSWYREKCETCHAPAECQRGPDCAGCHMPKSPVQDVAHGMLTDHDILKKPAKPGQRDKAPEKPDWHLRAFSPADAGVRELGLAYAEVSSRTGNPRQQEEAFKLLTTVPKDEEVEIRLADLYRQRGDTDKSAELYQAVLQTDPNSIVALVNLANHYGSRGALYKAITLWRQALTRNPCQPEATANLAKAYQATGDVEQIQALKKSQSSCVH